MLAKKIDVGFPGDPPVKGVKTRIPVSSGALRPCKFVKTALGQSAALPARSTFTLSYYSAVFLRFTHAREYQNGRVAAQVPLGRAVESELPEAVESELR